MKLIVPVRLVPLGDPILVNRTVTVHDAPGARFVPVQVSGPANAPTLKMYVAIEPPETLTPVTATDEPPAAAVLVNVTVPVPVKFRMPDGKVIVSGFGKIETAA